MTLKNFKYILTAALLMAAVVVFGQNKSAGINLSFWNKAGTQPYNESQQTYFNLGILSKQNKLHGLSINLIGSTNTYATKGIQVAGLSSITGESSYGLNMAGILTLSGTHANGITFGGITNIVGESQHGLVAAGILNIVGIDTKGVTLAGLLNLSGYNSQGVMVGGLANIIGEDMKGLSLAGLLAISESNRGASIAGLINISDNTKGFSAAPLNINAENFYGLQTGIFNLNASNFYGAQLGFMNVSDSHKGLQIGIVNYYQEQMKGMQLGLININAKTQYDVLFYGGNRSKLNLAVRFKNKLFYNLIGLGAPYLKFNDKFSGAIHYRTGIHFPIGQKFDIAGDIGFSHINTFKNKNKEEGVPRRLYALESRLTAEYDLSSKFSFFLTGGYGTTRWYSKSKTYEKGFIAEGGIAHRL